MLSLPTCCCHLHPRSKSGLAHWQNTSHERLRRCKEHAYCFCNVIFYIQKPQMLHLVLHRLQVAMSDVGKCASSARTKTVLLQSLAVPHLRCSCRRFVPQPQYSKPRHAVPGFCMPVCRLQPVWHVSLPACAPGAAPVKCWAAHELMPIFTQNSSCCFKRLLTWSVSCLTFSLNWATS